MRPKSSRRTELGLLATLLLSASALAGGDRNAAGFLQVPITGQVHQFDRQKIEIRYLKRILVFKREFAGLPEKLEPRPDQFVRIRFTLAEWQKFSAKLNATPITKQTRIDLRDVLP